MKPLTSFLVLTWFVGLCVKYATSLKCFECEGYGIAEEEACRSNVNPGMIVTCSEGVTLCSISKLDITQNGGLAYTKRACFVSNQNRYDNQTDDDDDGIEKDSHTSFTVCDSDLCNGGINSSSANIILLTNAILFLSSQKAIFRI